MKKVSLLLIFALILSIACTALADETFFTFSDSYAAEEGEASQSAEPAETESGEPVWSYPISREILDDPLDLLVLTNKENLLESDYPPSDDLHKLMDVSTKSIPKSKSSDMEAREIAMDALVEMFAAAEADGARLRVHSAYRSYRTQAIMYENRLKDKGYDDGVVQMPGASEHQTGLVFDIVNPKWAKEPRLTTKFAESEEGKWLAQNCADFGFIIRYGKDKEEITGIMYEPWHLRYVGKEVARYMTDNNLSLEEFTSEWRFELAEFLSGSPSSEALVTTITFN